MSKTAVVAIGGNSLILDPKKPNIRYQWDAVRETCRHLADMVEQGWQLIITHGNGPQAGYILLRNELAANVVHSTPLDLIVADTQGSIGYMLQQALRNELRSRGSEKPIVALVTQTLVNPDDPAFDNPTKPIGQFMTEAEAQKYKDSEWHVVEDAGRGWRRVVASPRPVRIIEENAVKLLSNAGTIVVAGGGGGIPVVFNPGGELREIRGVYAIVDKDFASGLLAKSVNADLFIISTGVEKVALNFNTPQQEELAEVTAVALTQHLHDGHFAAGSMQPKAEAVLDFVQQTGNPAIITNPENLSRALKRETGTWILPKY